MGHPALKFRSISILNGANINKRIHLLWDVLIPMLEVRELYDKRYAQLMKDKGIFK